MPNQRRNTGKRGQNGTSGAPLGPFTLSQMGLFTLISIIWFLSSDFDYLILTQTVSRYKCWHQRGKFRKCVRISFKSGRINQTLSEEVEVMPKNVGQEKNVGQGEDELIVFYITKHYPRPSSCFSFIVFGNWFRVVHFFQVQNIGVNNLIPPSFFLDATASPNNTYPCQWVSQSVSGLVIHSFRFGDSYRISELCEPVSEHTSTSSTWKRWKRSSWSWTSFGWWMKVIPATGTLMLTLVDQKWK